MTIYLKPGVYYEDELNYFEAKAYQVETKGTDIIAHWKDDKIKWVLNAAISTNKSKATECLLDWFEIPKDQLTLKERIVYYQLLECEEK